MTALIAALMVWASAHTGLPVPDALPNVVMIDHCKMQRLYTGDPEYKCKSNTTVRAFYGYSERVIYLPESWSPADLHDVSTLLHELVHHMQAEAGMEMGAKNPCPGKHLELPAYEAQMDFLEAAGVDAMETMGMNKMFFVLITSCMPRM